MEQISSTATNKAPTPYKITFRKIASAASAEVLVHKKLAIITYVLYGVAMLLFTFNANIYNYGRNDIPAYFNPSGWGAAFAIAGVVTSFFAVINVFRDTGNQQLCDVGMALPIKAWERFLSKLMCLFIIQVAPFIVSVLGGNGLAVFMGSLKYGQLDDDTGEMIFSLVVGGLGVILFIMAVTTLCACCCGAPAESVYFSFITMFIVNLLPIAFLANILDRSAGYTQGWSMLFDSDSLSIDLRFWGFLSLINDEMTGVISHSAVSCVISVAVILLSGFIYNKRDARSVGTPISSKLFFELVMAGGCATIFALTAMNDALLWGILIAGVAYIIINIIVSRAKINALSFVKWIGKFALTIAVLTVVTVASVKTGGFGYYRLRPDKAYLDGATFSIRISRYYSNIYDDDPMIRLMSDTLTAEQADEIMKICKKHIQKGVAEVNPFAVMLDTNTVPYVNIYANSDVPFYKKPSPAFMFYYSRYFSYHIENNIEEAPAYYLDFSQGVYISNKEALALAEELRQLDYVFDINVKNEGYSI